MPLRDTCDYIIYTSHFPYFYGCSDILHLNIYIVTYFIIVRLF